MMRNNISTFLHFHSFLSGEHYSHKGLGYDHQPSYLSWWVVLQAKQNEKREGAPKYMIIDCLFSHFEHKFQPSLPSKIIITKSTLRGCFYHWGLMDRMKCLCVNAEALKNAKISSQTFLSVLSSKFTDHCLSIFRKDPTHQTANPTILGDTAPPSGCSQYLTGTSGSFYRLPIKNLWIILTQTAW